MAGGDKKKWKKHLWMYSRYNQPRYVTYLGDDWYQVEGPAEYIRGGDDFFDFEGGPMLMIGEFFDLYSEIVEIKAQHETGNDHAIVKVKVCNTQAT